MTSHAYSHLPPHTGDLPADTTVSFSPWKPCRGIWPRASSRPKETETSLSLKTSGRIPEGGPELGGHRPAAWQCLGRQGMVCPAGRLPDSADWPRVIPHTTVQSLVKQGEKAVPWYSKASPGQPQTPPPCAGPLLTHAEQVPHSLPLLGMLQWVQRGTFWVLRVR